MSAMPSTLDLVHDEPPARRPSSANCTSTPSNRASHARTDSRASGLIRPRHTSPRLDFHLLDGEGATVEAGAAAPDVDGLRGLSQRLECHGAPIRARDRVDERRPLRA
jgi:hypothetical protein